MLFVVDFLLFNFVVVVLKLLGVGCVLLGILVMFLIVLVLVFWCLLIWVVIDGGGGGGVMIGLGGWRGIVGVMKMSGVLLWEYVCDMEMLWDWLMNVNFE